MKNAAKFVQPEDGIQFVDLEKAEPEATEEAEDRQSHLERLAAKIHGPHWYELWEGYG